MKDTLLMFLCLTGWQLFIAIICIIAGALSQNNNGYLVVLSFIFVAIVGIVIPYLSFIISKYAKDQINNQLTITNE